MRRRTLSDAAVERILSLREAGETEREIATAIGCSRGAVRYHCLLAGVDHPERATFKPAPEKPVTFVRGGKTIRRFTRAEDVLIRVLRLQHFPVSKIAKRCRRSYSSIIGRLITLARQDELRGAA